MIKRQIESALLSYVKSKLAINRAALAAIAAKDFRQVMVFAAESMVGFREATGHNDGREIEWIQETVGGHAREPYCVGGVQSCIACAEELTAITSPLIATELATGLWFATPAIMRVKNIPLPGAIAIWRDIDKKTKKPKITGHAEIVSSAANTIWHGIGFNTSGSSYPGGPVIREGNGVYYTTRNYAKTPSRELLGFIKPI